MASFANGKIPTNALSALPLPYSNKRAKEYLMKAAYASLTRMMLRAVADTSSYFSIWDAYRSFDEQVAMLKKNYVVSSSGNRSYGGKKWKKKPGHPQTASPGYSNHGQGISVDIHPGPIQAWMKQNAARFGWENDVPSESWHWSYKHPSRDRYRSEGTPDVKGMQKKLGVEADGKPGPGTAKAVRTYQKSHGLTVDGIPGPKTMAAILGKGDATPASPEGGSSAPANTTGTAVNGIYPWADSTSQWFEDAYTGQAYKDGGNKGLLHSTEGSGWPGYGGGSSAPHLTIRFDTTAKTVAARQHFKSTRPSRALVNKSGGVQTNNQDVFQIELVGTCDKDLAKKGIPYLPDLLTESWARDGLAAMLAAVSKDRDIPLTSKVSWTAYPGSYGEKATQRLAGDAWTKYEGWLGHQHAPENDHGDPGDLPIAQLLKAAGSSDHVIAGGTITGSGGSSGAGRLVVDSDWGDKTSKALQRFLNSRVKSARLVVDGDCGEATWKALQVYLAAPVKDGKISRQSHRAREVGRGIVDRKTAWEYTGPRSSGSQTMRLLQRWTGTTQDGIGGPGTTKALQVKLNAHGVGM